MQRMTIVIPVWDNAHVRYESGIIKRIESDLVNLFGGFTCFDVRGAWKDSDGKVYTDDSYQYEILTEYHYGILKDYARDIGRDLNQLSILCTCESVQVDFVS